MLSAALDRLQIVTQQGQALDRLQIGTQQGQGTAIKYEPVIGSDTLTADAAIGTTLHCITAATSYQNKSLEELRFEDYNVGRKGPTSKGNLFGQSSGQFGRQANFHDDRRSGGRLYSSQQSGVGLSSSQQSGVGLPFSQKSEGGLSSSQQSGVGLSFSKGGMLSDQASGGEGFFSSEGLADGGGEGLTKPVYTTDGLFNESNHAIGLALGLISTPQDDGCNMLTNFEPTKGIDTLNKGETSITVNTRLHCITASLKYQFKSLEELRFEHHVQGPTSTGGRLFGITGGVFDAGMLTKFEPTNGIDTLTKGGLTVSVNTRLHCITANIRYQSKSLEEIRFEYYAQGVSAGHGLFGGGGVYYSQP